MLPCWHTCGQAWPCCIPAFRFVVLAKACAFACCCCGCCWVIALWNPGGAFPSGVCPSIPDLCDPTALCLLWWLGVPGTGGKPLLQPPLPSPLSAIPGLGQPCTPWLPGSIPATPLRAANSQLRYHVEGSNLQKPLDLPGSATRTPSLRNKTVHTNQVSRSQSSAIFTAHKRRNVSQHLLLCLFLLTCHFLDTKKMRMNAACWHPYVNVHKDSQKTHVNSRNLYIKTWFVHV